MQLSDVRFQFDYDRWATTKVLDAAVGVDDAIWSAPNAIGERGLGGTLIHVLGAQQRWRHGLSGSSERPRPEAESLPTVDGLRPALTAAGHSPGDLDPIDYAAAMAGTAS